MASAFAEYCGLFLSKLKQRTQGSYHAIWRLYAYPIGRLRPSEVGTCDVTTLYRNIALVKGLPIIAWRAVGVLRVFWNKLLTLDSAFELPCPARRSKLASRIRANATVDRRNLLAIRCDRTR